MGATVILTSSSDDKRARAAALGADHTLNYRATPEWGAEVVKLTGGRGVDHVLELGGPGTLPQSIIACRVGGHISLIGTLTGFAGQVPTATMMRKQIRLQGLIVGSRTQQQQMVAAMNDTGIRPGIDRTFALTELADAFRYEESNRHFGKICLSSERHRRHPEAVRRAAHSTHMPAWARRLPAMLAAASPSPQNKSARGAPLIAPPGVLCDHQALQRRVFCGGQINGRPQWNIGRIDRNRSSRGQCDALCATGPQAGSPSGSS